MGPTGTARRPGSWESDVVPMAVHEFGDGPAGVLVHGSFGWGLETFPDQRELADSFRIVLVDRGGYNGAPAGAVTGWPADASDLVTVLEDYGGAHLVGQSYGAVVALVAAGRRPDLVRSLVVIEPPCTGSPRTVPLSGQSWRPCRRSSRQRPP